VPRLVVVLPLQPLELGSGFALRDWPLHVTVAPTFVIEQGLPAVLAAITPRLAEQRSIGVCAGPDEGFGRSGNIPVTVVDASVELINLHLALVGALRVAGAVFDDPDFVGAGYRAHVTKTRTAQLSPGDPMLLRQAVVVDMEPAGDDRLRRVIWTQLFRN